MNSNNPNHINSENSNGDINENKNLNNGLNNSNNGINDSENIHNTNDKDIKNKINYIQLPHNKNSNKKKRKNKRYIQEQMKEDYNNYIESKNETNFNINKSYNHLMLNEIYENKEYYSNKNNTKIQNSFIKSKSFNNFNYNYGLNKVKEMKETIIKNASYNLIGDIVLEINDNVKVGNMSLIKSSNSLTNITKSPSKSSFNEPNIFSYLVGEDCIDLESDEIESVIENKKNTYKSNEANNTNDTNNAKLNLRSNKKNKKLQPIINFDEINDIDNKINLVADYHLIHTPFKMIGEEILNKEINSKYKSKAKINPENESIIKKLRETFKKLVYKEIKDKPNISQILLDSNLDDDLKVKILRKYIKFTTEDEVFTNEADKIKIEIKNLLKQKKFRESDDYEELGKQVEMKVMPVGLKTKLEDIYFRVISGDQPKLHNMLNNLLKLPFETKSNILDQISKSDITKEEKCKFIKTIYSKLNEDLYGMEETKDSLVSWICQKISNPNKKSSKYLCLCGSAGVGKTSIIHSISKSLGIPYSYISLANVDEPGTLIGHGYTYEGSQYGSIANGLISNGCTNGILLFDELDKVKEKVQNTLLGIFDPLQNTKFRDAYFGEFALNISECMMIVCVNDISNVNPILKDRLHIVNIPGYTVGEKKIIISKYIIPKLNSQYNLEKIIIEDKVIDEIIVRTKKYEGIRQIQMYVTKIYELMTLDEYTNKYNFNGVFGIKNISLLKLNEENISYLSLYS